MSNVKLLIVTALSLALFSCNEEDNLKPGAGELPLIDEVSDATVKLVQNFNATPKSKATDEPITIENCEKTTFTFPANSGVMTKSSTSVNEDSVSVDLYLVNFKKGAKHGYSIATADNRINSVYAYTENGQISDTALFEPLKEAIEVIPTLLEKDLMAFYNAPSTKAETTVAVNIGPLLRTCWTQAAPYNDFCQECPITVGSQYDGHTALGCVGTATAQVIAYYQKYNGSYFGNDRLDFNKLTSYPNAAWLTTDQQKAVANFCLEVGVFVGTKYECAGEDFSGGSTIAMAYHYLIEQGYSCEYANNKNVDLNKLYANMQKGNVHLSGGHMKGGSGHAWVWDGIRGELTGTTLSKVLLHCNWGNSSIDLGDNAEGTTDGWENGWFANYEKPNVKPKPYLDDNEQCYITEKK